jgi:NADH-quinone oxidoreductase subunit G
MRIVPREKESINEVWLSDRDRFSYDGLNSPERLTNPMIKHHGEWHETDWKTALEFAARQIKETVEEDPAGLGFLVSPNATMEEGFLTKKIARALNCGNVDHRLRRSDFRLDGRFHGTPWMGCNIADGYFLPFGNAHFIDNNGWRGRIGSDFIQGTQDGPCIFEAGNIGGHCQNDIVDIGQ